MEKKKVGRPKKQFKEKQIRTIYISDSDHQYFKMLGDGNFSKGLEEAKKLLIQFGDHLDLSKKTI